jgi:hypothetical protein
MKLDDKTKDMIKNEVMPIIKDLATGAIVSAVTSKILELLVTNFKNKSLAGDEEVHPTKQDASMSKTETSAKDTNASLAKDEVTAKDGDLSAVRTDAAASSGEATAAESGATAARTKAGAADIETKALKMT